MTVVAQLLPLAALASVFTAGVFARSVWKHERDVFRRARAHRAVRADAAVAALPALNSSKAWGWPARPTDEVAHDLNELADTLILARP